MDQKTRLILYKLVNNAVLEDVNGVVSAGKEAVIFHADGGRYVLSREHVPMGHALCVCIYNVEKVEAKFALFLHT